MVTVGTSVLAVVAGAPTRSRNPCPILAQVLIIPRA